MEIQGLADIFKQHVEQFIQTRKQYIRKRQREMILVKECSQTIAEFSNLSFSDNAPLDSHESQQVLIARESLQLRSQRAGVTINDFVTLKVIGEGAFSIVYLVRHTSTKKIYALKKIYKEKVGKAQDGIRVRTERAVMLHFHSQYLIQLHYSFQDAENLYFVMTYAPGGDVKNLLDMCGCFTESWARRWFAQMLCSVFILHGTSVANCLQLDQQENEENIERIVINLKNKFMNVASTPDDSQFSRISVLQQNFIGNLQHTASFAISTADAKNPDNAQVGRSKLSAVANLPEIDEISKTTETSDTQQTLTRQRKFICLEVEFDPDSKQPSQNNLEQAYQQQTYEDVFEKQEFVHRDLKPQNFLLQENGDIVLADFGFAKELDHKLNDQTQKVSIQNNSLVGTLNYMSPEQFKEGQFGKYVDYWALGCIMFEMLTGMVAFQFDDNEKFIAMLQTANWEEITPTHEEEFQYLSEDAKDLIKKLLCKPDERLGRTHNLKQLICHKFFTRGESIENILSLNNKLMQKMIQNPDSMTDEDYENIPFIPLEQLLQYMPSPWKPPLKDETDLQYFKQANQEEETTTSRKSAELSVNSDFICGLESVTQSTHISQEFYTFNNENANDPALNTIKKMESLKITQLLVDEKERQQKVIPQMQQIQQQDSNDQSLRSQLNSMSLRFKNFSQPDIDLTNQPQSIVLTSVIQDNTDTNIEKKQRASSRYSSVDQFAGMGYVSQEQKTKDEEKHLQYVAKKSLNKQNPQLKSLYEDEDIKKLKDQLTKK